MQIQNRRNGVALVLFILGFMLLVTLALASTTWAAPNAQGTVPTPPNATAQPTSTGGGGNDGGGQNSGGQDNGGGQDGGGDSNAAAQPTPAPGAGSVCAIGENGAQCSVENLIIVVGAGAAPAGSALTIEGPFGQPPCPASPEGNNFLNRCFRHAWIGTNAEPLASISAPVQYCMSFGPEQIAATNNKPETILVGFANAEGKWTVVKPTIDTAGSRACATTNQEIVWSALFAPQAGSTLLPTVGGEWNAWWMIPVALLGMLMMLGAIGFARQGKA